MYSLDVIMPQAGCCVAARREFGAGSIQGSVSVRGHLPASGVRLARLPPIQACRQHTFLVPFRHSTSPHMPEHGRT